MAEEIRDDLVSKLVEAKNGYRKEIEHNFTLPGELTVEITLSEYRSLIKDKGGYEKRCDELQHEVWDKEKILDGLRKENEKLKEKILAIVNGEKTEEENENEEE